MGIDYRVRNRRQLRSIGWTTLARARKCAQVRADAHRCANTAALAASPFSIAASSRGFRASARAERPS